MRLAFVVEYEGTNYRGFQYQDNAPSIQEELEKAIERTIGERLRVKAAGRTDAGVHARGQVVAFDTLSLLSADRFVGALNFYLPDDIAVRAGYTVREDFDPRRDALTRRYRYTILNSATPSPLLRRTVCRIQGPLDIGLMREAAALLAGEHDFVNFSAPLEDGRATVRRIYETEVTEADRIVAIEVVGNAFLPHQVRRMAGALVDVGKQGLSMREFKQLIDNEAGERTSRSLPGRGLCLMQVTYSEFPPEAGEWNEN